GGVSTNVRLLASGVAATLVQPVDGSVFTGAVPVGAAGAWAKNKLSSSYSGCARCQTPADVYPNGARQMSSVALGSVLGFVQLRRTPASPEDGLAFPLVTCVAAVIAGAAVVLAQMLTATVAAEFPYASGVIGV